MLNTNFVDYAFVLYIVASRLLSEKECVVFLFEFCVHNTLLGLPHISNVPKRESNDKTHVKHLPPPSSPPSPGGPWRPMAVLDGPWRSLVTLGAPLALPWRPLGP